MLNPAVCRLPNTVTRSFIQRHLLVAAANTRQVSIGIKLKRLKLKKKKTAKNVRSSDDDV
jgi:hypothetical protein